MEFLEQSLAVEHFHPVRTGLEDVGFVALCARFRDGAVDDALGARAPVDDPHAVLALERRGQHLAVADGLRAVEHHVPFLPGALHEALLAVGAVVQVNLAVWRGAWRWRLGRSRGGGQRHRRREGHPARQALEDRAHVSGNITGQGGRAGYFLLDFRITSFSPDHTSSTAHTLMSTNPSGSASSRTVSSLMSVATFEDFFGHETQMAPSCFSFASAARRFPARSFLLVENR